MRDALWLLARISKFYMESLKASKMMIVGRQKRSCFYRCGSCLPCLGIDGRERSLWLFNT